MPIDQALEELKQYVQDLTSVGDAREYIKVNRQDFLNKFAKVAQYYNYIKANCKGTEWADLVDITANIKRINPSLDRFVEIITRPQLQQTRVSQTSQRSNFDSSGLTSTITSLVSEINNMRGWEPKEIEEIEWRLKKCQEQLVTNKDSFSPNVYQILSRDISATLNKINSFKNMLNSEEMRSALR